MKRLLVASLLILVCAPVVHAQNGESIQRFDVNALITRDSRAVITETIVYDFGENYRKGIFRNIPKRYFESENRGYQTDVRPLEVSLNNNSVPYDTRDSDPNWLFLKIGDPNGEVSGSQTYQIKYSISPINVLSDDNQQIVRIDAPGPGWEVPVESVTITFDSSISTLRKSCFQGPLGATEECLVSGNRFSNTRPLNPGETITASAEFEDVFTARAIIEDFPEPTPAGSDPFAYFVFGMVGLGVFFSVVKPGIENYAYKRRRKNELVIPRYEPPQDMTPAELGLLLDNSSAGAELTATIMKFATSGSLKIIETKPKKWWRSAQYNFQKLEDSTAGYQDFEIALLDALFADKNPASVKDLSGSFAFQKANRRFHKSIEDKLVSLGFYKKVNLLRRNLASRMTDAGYTKWAEVEGFRDFLKVTEEDRLAFHDAPAKKPEQFSRFLPYAVALGVEKEWADQFKDLDVQTDWYEGTVPLRAANIANISSITNSLNSMSRTANRSAGTSGVGGGFSGGGFSGGGGGSW